MNKKAKNLHTEKKLILISSIINLKAMYEYKLYYKKGWISSSFDEKQAIADMKGTRIDGKYIKQTLWIR